MSISQKINMLRRIEILGIEFGGNGRK